MHGGAPTSLLPTDQMQNFYCLHRFDYTCCLFLLYMIITMSPQSCAWSGCAPGRVGQSRCSQPGRGGRRGSTRRCTAQRGSRPSARAAAASARPARGCCSARAGTGTGCNSAPRPSAQSMYSDLEHKYGELFTNVEVFPTPLYLVTSESTNCGIYTFLRSALNANPWPVLAFNQIVISCHS